jgi:drug/metabolite transporter (DMT)-like permease
MVAVIVACRAALPALRARYPRALQIATSLLLLHGFVLFVLARAAENGSLFLLDEGLSATKWIATVATVLATLLLAWRVFAERLLTLRSVGVAVLISVAFGAAWLTVLQAAGVHLTGMPAMATIWMLTPVLLPLMASVLAPWSLGRARHT